MHSKEIRRRFLDFFASKGHEIVPSSPVIPHDDPSLLFTNAGMNQFKDVFLGKHTRPYKRATTAQKCIRAGGKHNDLDNVGHTSRHMTFFEMLGNFSFGDYFKEEAIAYAWECVKDVLELDTKSIWISVFEEDMEALAIWKKYVPEHRIVRMGEKDNFWSMGETGPCGPCSELYFDRGEKFGNATSPKDDSAGERFCEFWNLVFMQYNKNIAGGLSTLPQQSIDTGSGLERVCSIKMGVDSVFATDILRTLISEIEKISQKTYRGDPAFHVIADHVRCLAFAISDGAQPGNVDRGYVLRKILRRAVRYGKTLGFTDPFLFKLVPCLIAEMGTDYPELQTAQKRIEELLHTEEENFLRTLKRGGNILSSIIEKALENPLKEIRGEDAFKLKDTYGFPLEEIMLLAKDAHLSVNLESYGLLEEEAKERSRKNSGSAENTLQDNLFETFIQEHGPSTFLGYDATEAEGTILAIVTEGAFVNSLSASQKAWVLLHQTPFYAEKGGQIGDIGTLLHKEALFHVTHCHSPHTGLIIHEGFLEKGSLIVGEPVLATVDQKRRFAISKNHTATHLIHWALEKVLGSHIKQAGSLVEPARLRFDFNHHKAPSIQELREIESLVNAKIRENSHVSTYELPFQEAQKRKDIKQFFGDKYGAKVRVVDIGDAKELCGGTHIKDIGTIGLVRIIKETSIAAGVRRIEAVTGKEAEQFMYTQEDYGLHAAGLIKSPLPMLSEKITGLLAEHKHLLQEYKSLKRISIRSLAKELIEKNTTYLVERIDEDAETLQLLAEEAERLSPTSMAFVFGSAHGGKAHILVRLHPHFVERGANAKELIQQIAPLIKGGGGGKADNAQAGGTHLPGLSEALLSATHYLTSKLTQ